MASDLPFSRRRILMQGGSIPLALALPEISSLQSPSRTSLSLPNVRLKVPDPQNIFFKVAFPDPANPTNPPIEIKLAGHYWYNAESLKAGRKCPAIVEFNPYRRRDGTIYADSEMYPWFAYNDYLCFRVDLQGAGDSEGVLKDEYTDEEISYCIQVINKIAALPYCDGNVGMMGKSWSAINSLMVAASKNRPRSLKAVVVNCGSDDRYNDDVHYMGGSMMFDNVSWPSSMWGWISQPPDPDVVGAAWKDIWRQRIQNSDFWFKYWGAHQTRDEYWSKTSVRDHYGDVGVPVFILSGWQDGYKNPVEHVVSGLTAIGKPVAGLIGPWGHKYPFSGVPGPNIDWLRYVLTHWWDRWLKGKSPNRGREWPQLPVWLGQSKEPNEDPCGDEIGKWVAEDGNWASRTKAEVYYLGAGWALSKTPTSGTYTISAQQVFNPKMLETSSWGECGNRDLPGDQNYADKQSLYFESAPLQQDLDCFGYPVVTLNVSANHPIANLAIRLCEISPKTGASHLVSYSFHNLSFPSGDMSNPVTIVPGKKFQVRVKLNLMGHTFKKGWRIRLALSSSFYPTLWEGPGSVEIKIDAGGTWSGGPSSLSLPGRAARLPEDKILQNLLPTTSTNVWVDPAPYVPMHEIEKGKTTREAAPTTINGKPGWLTYKVFDDGDIIYNGPLNGLRVKLKADESYKVETGNPLSFEGSATSTATMSRGKWTARSETTSRVWSVASVTGFEFHYEATVKTFISEDGKPEEPFESKTVSGTIPRVWL
jgi:uncharacterized protein